MSERATSGTQALTGYVEAITEKAALGWVWRPGHPDRVSVTLRGGGETIATASADAMRADLAQNGIGDGRHAFSLPIPTDWQNRIGELRVFAVGSEGRDVPLDLPSAANAPPDASSPAFQRGLDALMASQRVLHRNLQSALLQKNEAPNALLAELEKAQSKLADSVVTVELFCARVEQSLALLASQRAPRTAVKPALAAAMGLSLLAFLLSAAALGWAMARG